MTAGAACDRGVLARLWSALGLARAEQRDTLREEVERLRAEVEALRRALAVHAQAAYAHAPVVRIHQAPTPR